MKVLSPTSATLPRLNTHKVDIKLLNSCTSSVMATKFNQCSNGSDCESEGAGLYFDDIHANLVFIFHYIECCR
jgi:hypothetical protein